MIEENSDSWRKAYAEATFIYQQIHYELAWAQIWTLIVRAVITCLMKRWYIATPLGVQFQSYQAKNFSVKFPPFDIFLSLVFKPTASQ
jgi:hypothetical protein